ncbi:MAG: TonB-dependent copper receptor, partial [Gallionella sp.]
SAGTVLFERTVKRLDQPGWKFDGSLMAGSFGRNDQVADIRAGTPDYYVQGTATRSDQNDYKDGDGRAVHSAFNRWSTSGAVGWTPDNDTRVELSAARSDGQAAYADRTVDGSRFDRENYGFKFEKNHLSATLEKIEAQAFRNYVDHVMDSYSLRAGGNPAGMMAAMNPDRTTTGGRIVGTFNLSGAKQLKAGVDAQSNEHTNRMGAAPGLMGAYDAKPRVEDASFRNYGLFGELVYLPGERDKFIVGLRVDDWNAQDKRATITIGMSTPANPTSGKERSDTLGSGFGRYEHDLAGVPATFYAGFGHTERFPDYWELISASKESVGTLSAFDSNPEKTDQLDAGMVYKNDKLSASVSGFYSKVSDYLMVQQNYVKPALMGPGTRTTTVVRNVGATTWGGEASLSYALAATWKADATLAYVHGDNDTDGTALAQLPPLEGRLGLTYDNKVWAVGSLLRLVSEQDRFDASKGNIVGQDIGRTGGFGVFSVNGAYRAGKGAQITAGIDNLFDKSYAEHISRGGSAVTGFTTTTRVNEMGRNLWLKANFKFD